MLLALIIGALTFLMAFIGLLEAGDYRFDLSYQGFMGFSALFFDSVRLLLMESVDPPPGNIYYAVARLGAVLFITLGILGILKQINKSVRYTLRMIWFKIIGPIHNPAVVIGLGRIGLPLINDIREQKKWGLISKPVYAISNQDLAENLGYAFGDGAIVIEGDATEDSVINKGYIKKAAEVFIATGDDSRNLEIAAKVKRQMEEKKDVNTPFSCKCYVHISDSGLTSSINNNKLFEEHNRDVDFEFFNTPDITARQFFTELILDQGIGLLRNRQKEEIESSLDSTNSAKEFSLPQVEHEEAFHLFIFGFEEIGKALALATARYAHFKSRIRPRITIFVDQSNGDDKWKAFLDRYTNFSDSTLDLTSGEIHDKWVASGSNVQEEVKSFEVSNEEELITNLQPHAVDYAVNAEFKPIITDIESRHLIGSICERLKSNKPDIKAAIAFCHDDERRNFDQALRLQYELSRELITQDPGADCELKCADSFSEKQLPIPIYAHLPVDTGLAELIESDLRDTGDDKMIECTNRNFPVHTFGSQEKIYSYDVIKNSGIKDYADSLEEAYQSAKQDYTQHPDFEDSTMNAVMLSEIKMDALNIYFSDKKEDTAPIFDEYYESEDIKKQLGYISENYKKETLDNTSIRRWIIPLKDIIEKGGKENGVTNYHNLYDRLLFLDRIVTKEEYEVTRSVTSGKKNLNDDILNNEAVLKKTIKSLVNATVTLDGATELNFQEKGDGLKEQFSLKNKKSSVKILNGLAEFAIEKVKDELKNTSEKATKNIIDSFDRYLKQYDEDADIAAEIEHNRWMGERLAKNWSFGKKDNFRKKRITFVPWELVPPTDKISPSKGCNPEDFRLFDRQMLPKIIMDRRERQEEGISAKEKSKRMIYAYVNGEKVAKGSNS